MPPRWSAEEDRVLRRLYADGEPLRMIAQAVDRSENAVAERRRTLKIPPRHRHRPWAAAEDALLRAGSALGLPAAVIAGQFGRPAEQVRRRRRTLMGPGRASPTFTATDDAQIIACWSAGGDVEALALELRRSPGSVRLRAQKLGLHRPRARRRWLAHEDAAVRDGYERGLTCAEIATELDARSAAAVAARAAKLGLATYARAWTQQEDARLQRLAREEIELERAARALGRTPEALRARARKLGIPQLGSTRAGRPRRPWTSEEDELLSLHRGLNPAALADLLDRSPEAITHRLRLLGLRDGARRSPHHPPAARGDLTPGQRITVMRELRAGGPGRQLALARRLGVSPGVIRALGSRVVRQ